MYTPVSFEVTDPEVILSHVRAHPFATLITGGDDSPLASHLPLLPIEVQGQVLLEGHLARPNTQWQAAGCRALAIFHGPHAYISAGWYQTPGTVPTWNYTAVHAQGMISIVDDQEELLGSLERLAQRLEPEPAGWRFSRTDPSIQKMLGGIVGIRITVDRWEAKFKLNQNHPVERRRRVIAELENRGEPDDRTIARLMRQTLPPDTGNVPTPPQ